MKKILLNNVKQLRWEKGMSCGELAKKAGISKGMMNMLENGKRIPSQITMLKISKAFELPMNEVFETDWKKLKM